MPTFSEPIMPNRYPSRGGPVRTGRRDSSLRAAERGPLVGAVPVPLPVATSEQQRDAIHRTLAQRAGGAPDANAIAEATLTTWHQVAARLSPVIGVRGVDVLFSRSLHLTSTDFPWLAITRGKEDRATQLASLRARLAERETASAAKASSSLLVTFTNLLSGLIGKSLTERLLGPVWAPPAAPAKKETDA
jgi:hypothetical protein